MNLPLTGPCCGMSTPRANTPATSTPSWCWMRCPARDRARTQSAQRRAAVFVADIVARHPLGTASESVSIAAPRIGNPVPTAPRWTGLGSLPHSRQHGRSVMPPAPRSNESATCIDSSAAPRGFAASARPATHVRRSARWTGTISGEPAAETAPPEEWMPNIVLQSSDAARDRSVDGGGPSSGAGFVVLSGMIA